MFKAFNAFIITVFTMLNDCALALGHLAKTAEESAGAYSDEARINRAANLAKLNASLKLTNSAKP